MAATMLKQIANDTIKLQKPSSVAPHAMQQENEKEREEREVWE
jgi:hypothetical protein